MDAKRALRSRYSNEPHVRGGSPVSVPPSRLTNLDIRILAILGRYRFLNKHYIAAVVGSTPGWMRSRLRTLKRKPHPYIKVCDEQAHNPRYYLRTELIYELGGAGFTELHERGIILPDRHPAKEFVHQVMTDQIMASFALGCTDTRRVITWDDILASQNMPSETKAAQKPWSIPVSYKHQGEDHTKPIQADGRPFGIRRTVNDKNEFLFFPGVEADCATEPIISSNYDRSSIHRKFLGYLNILDQNIHRSHFGFPNLFIPIVTTSQRRMASMMNLLNEMTDGQGSKNFLFKTHPTIKSSAKARATGHMVSEPWHRVSYPPLQL
jgi:hypothetical protein